jgi:hypothetical protein
VHKGSHREPQRRRGPFWTPITPQTGSFFHAETHVAVGEEQDAFPAAGLPEPPDDLKGGVGLAGAGCHDKQDAVLTLGDSLDRRIDGIDLIVARGLAAAVLEVVLKHDLLGFRVETLPSAITCPEIGGRRERIEGQRRLGGAAWGGAVMEHEAVAV